MSTKKHVWDFMEEFATALTKQLQLDEERWGNTWLHRDIGEQNTRIYNRLRDYWDQWTNANNNIPWLKIAGLAMIAWIRENYPEMLISNTPQN